MRERFRKVVAWLFAAVVLVAVVLFELLLWLFLAFALTLGIAYELCGRLVRLMRSQKPIEQRRCVQCDQDWKDMKRRRAGMKDN